jgi:hypothetical protein
MIDGGGEQALRLVNAVYRRLGLGCCGQLEADPAYKMMRYASALQISCQTAPGCQELAAAQAATLGQQQAVSTTDRCRPAPRDRCSPKSSCGTKRVTGRDRHRHCTGGQLQLHNEFDCWVPHLKNRPTKEEHREEYLVNVVRVNSFEADRVSGLPQRVVHSAADDALPEARVIECLV